jgi:hypothetical protein
LTTDTVGSTAAHNTLTPITIGTAIQASSYGILSIIGLDVYTITVNNLQLALYGSFNAVTKVYSNKLCVTPLGIPAVLNWNDRAVSYPISIIPQTTYYALFAWQANNLGYYRSSTTTTEYEIVASYYNNWPDPTGAFLGPYATPNMRITYLKKKLVRNLGLKPLIRTL